MNDIPAELLEHIFMESEPQDLAALASCCRRYHDILYKSKNQIIWRNHFLCEFDDPRFCVTVLGEPVSRDLGSFDWKGKFQRRFRANSVLVDPVRCRPEEVATILRTLISINVEMPPPNVTFTKPESLICENLQWLLERHAYGPKSLPRDFIFYIQKRGVPPHEQQLSYQLQTRIGLSFDDLFFDEISSHQSIAFRHRTLNQNWGPFQPTTSRHDDDDSLLEVDWKYVNAVQNIFARQFLIVETFDDGLSLNIHHFNLLHCRAQFAENSHNGDWVGANGIWVYHFCLIEFHNNDEIEIGGVAPDSSWNATQELGQFDARLVVTGTLPDPLFPTRPTICFAEEGDIHSIQGSVSMTSEQQIRWKLEYTSQDFEWQAGLVWSFDGVQVGSAENFGVLGTYFNPIRNISAPAWLRKTRTRVPELEGENNG